MFREILKKEGGKLCSFEMEFEDEFSDAFEFDQDLTIKGAIPLASLLRKKGSKEQVGCIEVTFEDQEDSSRAILDIMKSLVNFSSCTSISRLKAFSFCEEDTQVRLFLLFDSGDMTLSSILASDPHLTNQTVLDAVIIGCLSAIIFLDSSKSKISPFSTDGIFLKMFPPAQVLVLPSELFHSEVELVAKSELDYKKSCLSPQELKLLEGKEKIEHIDSTESSMFSLGIFIIRIISSTDPAGGCNLYELNHLKVDFVQLTKKKMDIAKKYPERVSKLLDRLLCESAYKEHPLGVLEEYKIQMQQDNQDENLLASNSPSNINFNKNKSLHQSNFFKDNTEDNSHLKQESDDAMKRSMLALEQSAMILQKLMKERSKEPKEIKENQIESPHFKPIEIKNKPHNSDGSKDSLAQTEANELSGSDGNLVTSDQQNGNTHASMNFGTTYQLDQQPQFNKNQIQSNFFGILSQESPPTITDAYFNNNNINQASNPNTQQVLLSFNPKQVPLEDTIQGKGENENDQDPQGEFTCSNSSFGAPPKQKTKDNDSLPKFPSNPNENMTQNQENNSIPVEKNSFNPHFLPMPKEFGFHSFQEESESNLLSCHHSLPSQEGQITEDYFNSHQGTTEGGIKIIPKPKRNSGLYESDNDSEDNEQQQQGEFKFPTDVIQIVDSSGGSFEMEEENEHVDQLSQSDIQSLFGQNNNDSTVAAQQGDNNIFEKSLAISNLDDYHQDDQGDQLNNRTSNKLATQENNQNDSPQPKSAANLELSAFQFPQIAFREGNPFFDAVDEQNEQSSENLECKKSTFSLGIKSVQNQIQDFFTNGDAQQKSIQDIYPTQQQAFEHSTCQEQVSLNSETNQIMPMIKYDPNKIISLQEAKNKNIIQQDPPQNQILERSKTQYSAIITNVSLHSDQIQTSSSSQSDWMEAQRKRVQSLEKGAQQGSFQQSKGHSDEWSVPSSRNSLIAQSPIQEELHYYLQMEEQNRYLKEEIVKISKQQQQSYHVNPLELDYHPQPSNYPVIQPFTASKLCNLVANVIHSTKPITLPQFKDLADRESLLRSLTSSIEGLPGVKQIQYKKASYKGQITVGKTVQRQGKGIYKLENGQIYYGNFNEGELEGEGVILFQNGDIFKGEFKQGLRCGVGIYYYNYEGYVYQGNWLRNRKEGQGKMYYTVEEWYEGQYVNNQQNGQGVQTFACGDRFEGIWKKEEKAEGVLYLQNGEKQMNGFLEEPRKRIKEQNSDDQVKQDEKDTEASAVFSCNRDNKGEEIEVECVQYFQNGDKYQGATVKKKREGRGAYYYANGCFYEGQWKNNMKEGEGKYIFTDGTYYEGQFKNSKKNGEGKQTFQKGESYEGDWVDDQRSGRGRYQFEDGSSYEGEWEADLMQGHGTYNIMTPLGVQEMVGTWQKGVLVEFQSL